MPKGSVRTYGHVRKVGEVLNSCCFFFLLLFFCSLSGTKTHNVNQLAFILDLSASVRFGRLFIVTLLHSLWELSLVHEYKAILFVD